jgi:hypothetical protein
VALAAKRPEAFGFALIFFTQPPIPVAYFDQGKKVNKKHLCNLEDK